MVVIIKVIIGGSDAEQVMRDAIQAVEDGQQYGSAHIESIQLDTEEGE